MVRKLNQRVEIYVTPREHDILRILAKDNGIFQSAYIRMLLSREWNASPHLHAQLSAHKEDDDE